MTDADLIALHQRLWAQDDDPTYDSKRNGEGCYLEALAALRAERAKEREAGR